MRTLIAGFGIGVVGIAAMLCETAVRAEPYLAVQNGYKCNVCHVNPTGGGLRNAFGLIFAESLMPNAASTGTGSIWNGKVSDFLRVGGDLRSDWERTTTANQPNQAQFSVEQMRLYADATLIPDKLGIYVDEQVAPNSPQNMEAYVRYGDAMDGWHLKGGKFYLPFGWRLQDQTAFVREATGISMTTPDNGIELGYEHGAWSAQFDVTNGAANAAAGNGHQVTGQAVYTKPVWRLGVASSFTQSAAGNRRVFGVFSGIRTGPVAWLGEADLIEDDGFPGGRTLASGLAEADWLITRGINLKVTAEYYDPDRRVAENQQTRWSVVYEYTPLPFLQLRAGWRDYRGIPQSALENRKLTFLQVHGFF